MATLCTYTRVHARHDTDSQTCWPPSHVLAAKEVHSRWQWAEPCHCYCDHHHSWWRWWWADDGGGGDCSYDIYSFVSCPSVICRTVDRFILIHNQMGMLLLEYSNFMSNILYLSKNPSFIKWNYNMFLLIKSFSKGLKS